MGTLQPWSKVLSPLHFRQVMHHFSQKIVTITNFLVFTYSFMLCALDQHKKTGENPPNLTYFHIQTPHSKNGLDKSPVASFTHMWKQLWKKCMENSSVPQTTSPILSNHRWMKSELLGRKNGDRQTDKVFCRPTPWVWQKCMENSGGTTFRWPVKLLRESNPTPNVCVC